MTTKFAYGLASSFCTLLLMTGIADAKGGGGGNHSSSSSSSSNRSSSSTPPRTSEPKKTETKVYRPIEHKVKVQKSEPKVVKHEPKVFKSEPKVERRVPKLEPKSTASNSSRLVPTKQTTTALKNDKLAKIAQTPKLLPQTGRTSLGAKTLAGAGLAGGAMLAANKMTAKHYGPTAPLADRHNHISSASMQKFVVTNQLQHNAKVFSAASGAKQYKDAINHAQKLIHDPSKGYKVAGYGEKGKQQGDNRTIVINENNKTVYVPASQVSGPDRRTIVVNCNNCKVVIVGDTAKNGQQVVDQRNIIVNGKNDKIVLQGDKASGANGTGQSGGTIKDERHVTVNGDKNVIKVKGDESNGGSGAKNGQGRGQDGGNGGKVIDTRTVDITKTGDKNKVSMGGDHVDGGKGGNGKGAGGNGGSGGDLTDKRTVNDQGNKNKVDTSRNDTANGGDGGSSF